MKVTKNLSIMIASVRKVNRFAANWLRFAIKNNMLKKANLTDKSKLLEAFSWEDTPQKCEYWYNIWKETLKK